MMRERYYFVFWREAEHACNYILYDCAEGTPSWCIWLVPGTTEEQS